MATEKVFFAIEVETGKAIPSLTSLQKAITATKESQKLLNKQFKQGKISEDAFAKSTVNNKTALKSLNSQYKSTEKGASGLTKKTSGLTKAFNKLGLQIAGAFAARAVLSGIGDTIDIIRDFEQANADLAAVLANSTTKELEKLEAQQLSLGATTVFTASEIAGLQLELAKLGFTTSEITAATEAVQELAAATNTDLAEAATIAASTVRAFGLVAEDTQMVVDVMAASFSQSGLDMEKFREAMKLVAPSAKATGRDIQTVTAQLGVLADNGIAGSVAGTQLNRVFIELNKKGLTLEQALDKVSKSSNKLGTATELVGDRGAKALLIFSENTDALGELEGGLRNAAGAAGDMADTQLDTLNGQLKLLNSAWEGFILSLEKGDGIMGKLARGGVSLLASALTQLTNIGSMVDVMFNGISDASIESRKALIQNADAMNVTLESGMALSEVLIPFSSQTLVELEENLGKNQLAFISTAMAQGENATESRLLFDAYLELRRETEKGIFTKEEDTKATIDNTKAKEDSKAIENDLIKKKQAEIRARRNVAAATKEETAVKNDAIRKLQEELKALQDLRVEQEKQEGFHFEKLELMEAEKLAKMEAKDESMVVFNAETDIINADLQRQRDLNQEKLQIARDGLYSIQNLTNVFTDNQLRDLDKKHRLELEAINKREENEDLTREEAEQERRALEIKHRKEADVIAKKAFKRNKAFSLATAAIDTAIAIGKAAASLPYPANVPYIAAAAALGAVQVATITAQKFKQGGIIEGASHDQGGVPVMGGRAEVEGGEVILTRGVAQNPSLLSAANQLNIAGGGQSFLQDGGILPNFAINQDNTNSELLNALLDINFNPVVSVTEISEAQNNVAVAESIATI